MIPAEGYISKLLSALKRVFGQRLLYLGLQGSYMRNEADENSDIDIMVILDNLSIKDMDEYKNILIETNSYNESCGFICGKEEIESWNPLEICGLKYSTKDYYGRLENFLPPYDKGDIKNYVKISLDNLYHALCHGYIHSDKENNVKTLPHLYKSAFFIIQNIHYLKTGEFIITKREMIEKADEETKNILNKAEQIKNTVTYDFDQTFEILFMWCKNKIKEI